MKKLISTTFLILLVGITFGQTLQKGNLVGLHVMTINLDPNVTMNQYLEFYTSKVIPEFEKHFAGTKAYLIKGIRGESDNSYGVLYFFESEGDRDKFFNDDGSLSELGEAANEKVTPISEELNKLGTSTTKYTDWIIQ